MGGNRSAILGGWFEDGSRKTGEGPDCYIVRLLDCFWI